MLFFLYKTIFFSIVLFSIYSDRLILKKTLTHIIQIIMFLNYPMPFFNWKSYRFQHFDDFDVRKKPNFVLDKVRYNIQSCI